MVAVSAIFSLVAIAVLVVDALAYGASIAAVSAIFTFKFNPEVELAFVA
jgi:hypothetical protein